MEHRHRQSLERTLRDAADALEAALTDARVAHRHYGRLTETDRSWSRIDAAVTDEVRRRRTDICLGSGATLVALLRQEAEAAATRYPGIDAHGEPLPPRPADDEPVTVRDWWAALAPDARDRLLEEEPGWVGSTDGLPVAVRHAANVRLLDAEISRRDALAAAHDDGPRDAASVEEDRDLRGLHKLRDFLAEGAGGDLDTLAHDTHDTHDVHTDPQPDDTDRPGDGAGGGRGATRGGEGSAGSSAGGSGEAGPGRSRYLYLLDAAAYPLKAAVVLGEVEQADTVILHVPGATTSVDLRLAREVQWMTALLAEAERLAPDQRVAVVDWIGYHAPYDIATRRSLGDSGVTVLVPGEASDDRYAREAAPVLAACAQGLRALRPRPARLVASGHSYGASVVGLALAATDAFDAAVVAGSPGLFTSDAASLRLPAGSLFAAIAPGDLIAFLGVFGGQVAAVSGVVLLSPFAWRVTYPDGQRALLRQGWGHESYYQPGSATLHAMAAAAVGASGSVRSISRRGILQAFGRAGEPSAG